MNQNSTLQEFIKSKEAQKSQGPKASLEPRPMLGGWEVQGEGADQFLPEKTAVDLNEMTPLERTSYNIAYLIDPSYAERSWLARKNYGLPPKLDINAGLGPVAINAPTPTSGSGIGTSFANDVNFLQEGFKNTKNYFNNQGPSTEDKIALGEERLQGYRDSEELSPQAQAAIQRPPIRMGQGTAPRVEQGLQPPMGVEATQARLQERFGAPTISDIQAAPKGLGMQTDPQGRMIDPNVDRSSFEQESAAREARIDQRADFGKAISDRDRRAARGEGMSDADRRDIAKANAQGASASDIARGMKVSELNGVDLKTGKPLAPQGGLTETERLNRERFEYKKEQDLKTDSPVSDLDEAKINKTKAETIKILSEIEKSGNTKTWDTGKKQAMKTQAEELAKWEINELPKLKSNISQLKSVAGSLEEGQIKTGGFTDQIPKISNFARPFLNPDGEIAKQEIAGVVMQSLKETFPGAISNEERTALVSTVYNPQLKPKDNAKLVRAYSNRLLKAMNAKIAQTAHFRKFGNLENYNGETPRSELLNGVKDTAKRSPIENDIDDRSLDDALL